MSLAAIIGWLAGVLLVSSRLAVLFIVAPPFAAIPSPPVVRVLLVIALAAGMAETVPMAPLSDFGPQSLASAMLFEVLVGAAFSTGLLTAFATFQFSGRLLDFQIGFGMANLIDIATRSNVPLLGSLLSMLATVFFFSIEGHLALFKVIHLSLIKLPPGTGIEMLELGGLISQFATCFSFGMLLVGPAVLCLLLVDFGMGFMSRTMPQMHVFIMAMALKVLVGGIVLATIIPFSGSVIQRVYDTVFLGWQRLMGHG